MISQIAQRPTSENKWEEHVQLGFMEDNWMSTYTTPYKATSDTKIIAFQLKVTHRLLAGNITYINGRLKTMRYAMNAKMVLILSNTI
jgi:hypothetical protein